MKKIYSLILLLSAFGGWAFSPPDITNPAPLKACDTNNDGVEIVDLTPVVTEVLGALEPQAYTVHFFSTLSDAENGTPFIAPINNFVANDGEVIFVRVTDNASPTDFAITTLEIDLLVLPTATISYEPTYCAGMPIVLVLNGANANSHYIFSASLNGGAIDQLWTNNQSYTELQILDNAAGSFDLTLVGVQYSEAPGCYQEINQTVHADILPSPPAGQPMNLTIDQIPYVGTAVFDLTQNDDLILVNTPGLSVYYFSSFADAQSSTDQFTDPSHYNGTNGQQVYARIVNDATGCFSIRNFTLYITNPDIVFIPDANLKARLLASNPTTTMIAKDLTGNFIAADANGDNEIQVTEAQDISALVVSNQGIHDLTGLQAFVNMRALDVSGNLVIAVPNTAMPLLASLSASQCNMYTLDLSNNPNLTTLDCNYNNLQSLNLSSCPLLTSVHAQNNILSSINLTGLTQLTGLWLQNNHLASINTADLNSIAVLNIGANSITSLDLTGLGSLEKLYCYENNIDSLNTNSCPVLDDLVCAANQMTYLEVSESTALTNLDCSNNTLINLDLGSNSALCTFNCAINYSLVTLNIKNGVDSCYTNFIVTDITNSLQQFCCDDNEVSYFRNYFLTNQGIEVNVNSYCSFVPGGDFNTIYANVKFDADGDGCDVNDGGYSNVRVNIFDQTNSGATFTDSNGICQFFTQAGSFDIAPALENPSWFTVSPASANIPFGNTNSNSAVQNFCIAPNGNHNDLEVVISPLTSARPGFDAEYEIVVKNKGNQMISQDNGINLVFQPNKMSFVTSSELPSFAGGEVLTWNLESLSPFESKVIRLTMHINAPTNPENPVNIGNILNYNVTVDPTDGDETPSDNNFQFNQTVVGSFDPNEIVCLEGNIVSPIEIGNYLHYTINFENTGTAAAENIVVRELIDTTQFDLSSLQLLDSSASVTTRLTGATAEFIFPSINLHSGGHGNILLKIRSKNTLVEGDTVSKRANIFFDYNFPVATDPENTLFQTLKNPDIGVDASISVYPNPTKGNVNIKCNNKIKSIELYDIQGRLLQTNLIGENQTSLDLSNQSSGVYFARIISDKGMKVEKIVRE